MSSVKNRGGSEKPAECKKCQASVNLMRSLLDLTDAAFDSSMVCKMLPFIGKKCDDFFSKYGDIIYEGIKANLDTTEICEKDLGLCDPDIPEVANTDATETDSRLYSSKARFFYKLVHLD
jgi:hypothetical protein